jgi:hypothetical protein
MRTHQNDEAYTIMPTRPKTAVDLQTIFLLLDADRHDWYLDGTEQALCIMV